MKATRDLIPATNPDPFPEVMAIFKKFAVPPSSLLSINMHMKVNKTMRI